MSDTNVKVQSAIGFAVVIELNRIRIYLAMNVPTRFVIFFYKFHFKLIDSHLEIIRRQFRSLKLLIFLNSLSSWIYGN